MSSLQLLPQKGTSIRVRFNGVIYRCYPKSKHLSDRKYYRAGKSDIIKGYSYLHRDIWKHRFGEIPEGFEVHHRDGNTHNNEIGNLQLLSQDEHKDAHKAESSARMRRRMLSMSREDLAKSIDKMRSWHSSPEGIEWHRNHAKNVAKNSPLVSLVCRNCNSAYQAKSRDAARSFFCGPNCRSSSRKRSGVDDVERTCVCGRQFRANKYAKKKFCGTDCPRR